MVHNVATGQDFRIPHPDGLASYVYTRSAKTGNAIAAAVESSMISINHHGLALPEVLFGGVKDSGYGSEGGWRRSRIIWSPSSSPRRACSRAGKRRRRTIVSATRTSVAATCGLPNVW
jgi:hypothetical protein